MNTNFQFNRQELAGSFGDLGTILPLALGMILINGLSPTGIFFSVGVFYILTGAYFGFTVPVQPMKVIGAYAIAAEMSVQQIQASTILMAGCLLLIGLTGTITVIGKNIPKSVIRGVQLSTGVLLMVQGVKMILGKSTLQLLHKLPEPYLSVQSLGPIPIGILIGISGVLITFFFLNNKKLPAGLIVIFLGLLIGLFWGTRQGFNQMQFGIFLPEWLPYSFPLKTDFSFAIFALVLPQIPMTLGNAVVANADLSKDYFGKKADKMSYKALCISMGFGNIISFLIGGMPVCHGAGGLAAHYRFGARTAGSNLMIGSILIILVVFFGKGILSFLFLIPMAVLGVLLLFAGSQLAITIIDIDSHNDMLVVVWILGITLALNLAIGFLIGILFAFIIKNISRKENREGN
jgi:SulP family sulfate permease